MCQHPIFIVARIPLFILYFLFTCCCDKSQEVNGEYEFKDSILSFEYIDWQNREVDNFQGFAAGPREVEFNRNLSVVRGTIRNRQSGNASMLQSMRAGNPSAIVNQAITGLLHMTMSNQHDCAICILELKANEKVTQLACFEHHVFHPECIQQLITHCASRGQTALCPICRKEIDKDKMVDKILKRKGVEPDDPFALGTGK